LNGDRYAHRLLRSPCGLGRQFPLRVTRSSDSAVLCDGAPGAGACARLRGSGLRARRSVGLSSFQVTRPRGNLRGSARPHFDGLQELSKRFQHSAFSVGQSFGLSVPPANCRHNHVRIRFVIWMIWGQDRQQLLRGGMPDVGGPHLPHVDLPRRRRVICAVVDGEAATGGWRGHVIGEYSRRGGLSYHSNYCLFGCETHAENFLWRSKWRKAPRISQWPLAPEASFMRVFRRRGCTIRPGGKASVLLPNCYPKAWLGSNFLRKIP